jgi:hypothetical protein
MPQCERQDLVQYQTHLQRSRATQAKPIQTLIVAMTSLAVAYQHQMSQVPLYHVAFLDRLVAGVSEEITTPPRKIFRHHRPRFV